MFESLKSRRRAPPANSDAGPASPAVEEPAAADESGSRPHDPAIDRYVQAIFELKCDAEANGRLHRLADILAYALARMAHSHGGEAVGYAIEMVGRHIALTYEHERAQAEAARAKQEGERPH